MKQIYLLLAITIVALTMMACGGASGGTTKSSAANSGSATQTTTEKSKPAAATLKNSTPSEAGESFFVAVKNKDKAMFKQLMSEDSLLLLKAAAEAKSLSLDDLLDKQFFPNTPMPEKCEQRGEKITGDKATTEMKNDKGEWSPMPFVKEGGVWKISLE